MINESYVVRWSGKDGVPHQKAYDSEVEARRAKQWLFENGALSVDIAVRINNKVVGTLQDKKKSDSDTNADQKGFWQND